MNRFLSFKSRIGRLEYFVTSVVLYAIASGVGLLLELLAGNAAQNGQPPAVYGLMALVTLAVILFFSVLTICKRLNDIRKPRWLAVMLFVPLANMVMCLYLLFKAGVDPVEPAQ